MTKHVSKRDLSYHISIVADVSTAFAALFIDELCEYIVANAMRGRLITLSSLCAFGYKTSAQRECFGTNGTRTMSKPKRKLAVVFSSEVGGYSHRKLPTHEIKTMQQALVYELAKKLCIEQRAITLMLQAFISTIADNLNKGKGTQIRGFGTFSRRKGRHNAPLFKPSDSTVWKAAA